jgi:hypothetical protein
MLTSADVCKVSETRMPIDSMLAIGSVHQHLIKSKLRTLAGLMIESVRQFVCVCVCVCRVCVCVCVVCVCACVCVCVSCVCVYRV